MYSKKIYIIIAAIVLLGGVLGVVIMQRTYEKKIDKKDATIAQLQKELNRIGELTYVYRLATDAKAGNECNDYDLETVEVPVSICSDNSVYDTETITGRYYKFNAAAGTILSQDMFTDFKISNDMRLMDVVFDEIPIGLESGDYIDVRIAFPLGQDYIAMTHKRVAEINGSTVKLVVEQRDFYCYESMKTDIATYESTKIYGAEYVEAGLQEAAKTYYPINLDVLLTMLKDPNINTGDYSEILAVREQLEEQLLSSDKIDIAQTVTSGRETISEKFDEAQEAYENLQIEKEQEAERAAIMEAQEAEEAEDSENSNNSGKEE